MNKRLFAAFALVAGLFVGLQVSAAPKKYKLVTDVPAGAKEFSIKMICDENPTGHDWYAAKEKTLYDTYHKSGTHAHKRVFFVKEVSVPKMKKVANKWRIDRRKKRTKCRLYYIIKTQ